MKEELYTIPVNEGFEAEDECPFCFMEREVEHHAIRYVVGPAATYMEPTVRAATGRTGFCTHHMKSLYDYGNHLGAAMMLQTHVTSVLDELKKKAEKPEIPEKKGLFKKKVQTEEMPYWKILSERTDNCYICDKMEYNLSRHYHTFFVLLKEKEFREKVEGCKGFCMRHFARLLQEAETYLPDSQREWFYRTVYKLMCQNLERVKEDLDWFVAKFDYRNASAPWKNSQDALPGPCKSSRASIPATLPIRKSRNNMPPV